MRARRRISYPFGCMALRMSRAIPLGFFPGPVFFLTPGLYLSRISLYALIIPSVSTELSGKLLGKPFEHLHLMQDVPRLFRCQGVLPRSNDRRPLYRPQPCAVFAGYRPVGINHPFEFFRFISVLGQPLQHSDFTQDVPSLSRGQGVLPRPNTRLPDLVEQLGGERLRVLPRSPGPLPDRRENRLRSPREPRDPLSLDAVPLLRGLRVPADDQIRSPDPDVPEPLPSLQGLRLRGPLPLHGPERLLHEQPRGLHPVTDIVRSHIPLRVVLRTVGAHRDERPEPAPSPVDGLPDLLVELEPARDVPGGILDCGGRPGRKRFRHVELPVLADGPEGRGRVAPPADERRMTGDEAVLRPAELGPAQEEPDGLPPGLHAEDVLPLLGGGRHGGARLERRDEEPEISGGTRDCRLLGRAALQPQDRGLDVDLSHARREQGAELVDAIGAQVRIDGVDVRERPGGDPAATA